MKQFILMVKEYKACFSFPNIHQKLSKIFS